MNPLRMLFRLCVNAVGAGAREISNKHVDASCSIVIQDFEKDAEKAHDILAEQKVMHEEHLISMKGTKAFIDGLTREAEAALNAGDEDKALDILTEVEQKKALFEEQTTLEAEMGIRIAELESELGQFENDIDRMRNEKTNLVQRDMLQRFAERKGKILDRAGRGNVTFESIRKDIRKREFKTEAKRGMNRCVISNGEAREKAAIALASLRSKSAA